VVNLAGTVDKAIKYAYQKGIQLPLEQGMLHTREHIETQFTFTETCLLQEDGVAEHYNNLTASFFLPVSPTLTIHPSFTVWASLLRWTKEVLMAKFVIADGALKLLKYNPTHKATSMKAIWCFLNPWSNPGNGGVAKSHSQ
jgi:hypothetical protein